MKEPRFFVDPEKKDSSGVKGEGQTMVEKLRTYFDIGPVDHGGGHCHI
jgi:hypothetical protein